VGLEEVACGIGAVDLEALLEVHVALDHPEVVVHGCDVEQFRIGVLTAQLPVQHAEQIRPPRMVIQQRRFGLTDEVRGLSAHLRVGDGDACDGFGHDRLP
jgi:hypothetical protein